MNVAIVLERDVESSREELVEAPVDREFRYFDRADGVFYSRLEKDKNSCTTDDGGLSGGNGITIRSGEDDGIVVAEGSLFRDPEGGRNSLPLIGTEREGWFGEGNPVEEVIFRFGIEELRLPGILVGPELHQVYFERLFLKASILDLDIGGDGGAWFGNDTDGEWRGNERKVRGLGGDKRGGEKKTHQKERWKRDNNGKRREKSVHRASTSSITYTVSL